MKAAGMDQVAQERAILTAVPACQCNHSSKLTPRRKALHLPMVISCTAWRLASRKRSFQNHRANRQAGLHGASILYSAITDRTAQKVESRQAGKAAERIEVLDVAHFTGKEGAVVQGVQQ